MPCIMIADNEKKCKTLVCLKILLIQVDKEIAQSNRKATIRTKLRECKRELECIDLQRR